MSFGNTTENDLLRLIFNGIGIANIADNAGTGPLTNLYVSLHTADPGEAGTQQTNECAYTNYARVAVARSGSGWVVTGNSVSPAADVNFPESDSGGETVTHFAIGTAASGTGKIIAYGTYSPNVVVAAGVAPRLKAGTTLTLN